MKKVVGLLLFLIIGYLGFGFYTLEYGKLWERHSAREKIEDYISNHFIGECEIIRLRYELKHESFFADIQISDDMVSLFQIEVNEDGTLYNYYYRAYWEAQIFEKCNSTLQQIFHEEAYFKAIFSSLQYEEKYGDLFNNPPAYDEVKEEISKNISLCIDLSYDWKKESFDQEVDKLYEACLFIKTIISFEDISIDYKNESFGIERDELQAMKNREDFINLLD